MTLVCLLARILQELTAGKSDTIDNDELDPTDILDFASAEERAAHIATQATSRFAESENPEAAEASSTGGESGGGSSDAGVCGDTGGDDVARSREGHEPESGASGLVSPTGSAPLPPDEKELAALSDRRGGGAEIEGVA